MMKLFLEWWGLSASTCTMSLGKSFHFETVPIKKRIFVTIESSLALLTYNLKGWFALVDPTFENSKKS